MNKLLFICLFLLQPFFSFAGDTTFYSNGKIQMISDYPNSRINYYQNGAIETTCRYSKLIRKGKMVNYDSLGNISSQGKTIFGVRKHGRWKEYENGNKHIVHYKYGIKKSKLRTEDGKKIKCLLTYGLGAGWNPLCDSAVAHYRVRYVAVAGCIVDREILFRTALHNFPLYLRKSLRYGFHWEDKIQAMCPTKGGF